MIGYIDASMLLSLLLQDKHATTATTWWYQCEDRASSILLDAECRIVLRRAATTHQSPKKWLADKEALLNRALEEMQLRLIDQEILRVIRDEGRLADCRTLDALHVATALHFWKAAETADLRLCSFDRRMITVAQSVGLHVMTE